jgi:hypothetical protein
MSGPVASSLVTLLGLIAPALFLGLARCIAILGSNSYQPVGGAKMSEGLPTPSVPTDLWTKYSPAISARIVAEYSRLKGQGSQSEEDDVVLWNEAIISFIRQRDVGFAPRPKWSWLAQNVTGLMVVAAILALAFGLMGVLGEVSGKLKEPSGFLDIAKLFAGALVGAAGGAAAAVRR